MKILYQNRFASVASSLAVIVATSISSDSLADTVTARNGVVASVHPLASEAGLAVLREGGTAVDAAVAAALTLSVVDGYNSGIGGGCLILIRDPEGNLIAIDGREMAPAAATRDMYIIDGKLDPEASQTGPLASGVPGALAAYAKAIELAGKKPLGRLLEPGRKAAAEGFEVTQPYARTLAGSADKLAQFAGSREVFLHDDGSPYREGERLVQADLAKTFAGIQQDGIDYFYRGEFAERVGAWMAEHGGIMTAADFANYEAKLREPLITTYRGRTIVGFPPPSSGGVHVAQVLNMLEGHDLGALHRESPAKATHLIAECFTRAFADRAHWLGDSDFVSVPRGIIDKEYARELARQIDLDRALPVESHGEPPEWRQDVFGRHTTHIAAADAQGYWVAITATVNTSFGSKVVVPGTGVVLNNEMDDFSIQPGVPNAFGLIGGENNAVEAGKRPLSSMSPTIVLDAQGHPEMTIGAAGGPKIITQVLLGIIRHIDYGEPIGEAVGAKRFHHQWRPNRLMIERGNDEGLVEDLKSRGHDIEMLGSAGVTQAIARGPDGELIGVSDPRVPGKASGY